MHMYIYLKPKVTWQRIFMRFSECWWVKYRNCFIHVKYKTVVHTRAVFFSLICTTSNHMSRNITKQTKWLCAQRRLRLAWASAQSDQSLRCADSEDSDQPGHRLWSDWADAQADLSLRWTHTHFVGFVMSWLKLRFQIIHTFLVSYCSFKIGRFQT